MTESRGAAPATEPDEPALAEIRCTDRDGVVRGFQEAAGRGVDAVLRTHQPRDRVLEFARSVVVGLQADEPSLDCSYLYDARGSRIYEQITRQPEYYPTRTEAAILRGHAAAIRREVGPLKLLELGSGSSIKTDELLDAWVVVNGARTTYIPVDVSASALAGAAQRIRQRFPAVQFIGVHGTYDEGLTLLGAAGPVLGMFLGSTLGNFSDGNAEAFLGRIAGHLRTDDRFLLGVDLVKDTGVLEAAYNDRAGTSAAFTLNLFERMNRELGSGIDVGALEHVARYSEEHEQIEIHARFHRRQEITVAPLDQSVTVEAGEEVLVEVSRKFQLDDLARRLRGLGLAVEQVYSDDRGWFAVLLLRRQDG